ncbi:hypothetical protein BS17DRAFT_790577, partial [Gyrodon lividus]
VEKRWQQKSGYGGITVDWKTMKRRMVRGQSSCQFNMETNGWLTEEEEENMVEFFVLTMAHEAFRSIMSP